MAACAKRPPAYFAPSETAGYASWYGSQFHGRKTASGETYDMYDRTAAHRTLPFGTQVRVVNLDNDRSCVVRINDRGPFVRGRVIDLSFTAAKEIGLVASGTARVRLDVVDSVALAEGRFFIQIGSFRDPENARRLAEEAREAFPAHPIRIVPYEEFHRVWFGPLDREEEAAKLVEDLRAAGYVSLILRR